MENEDAYRNILRESVVCKSLKGVEIIISRLFGGETVEMEILEYGKREHSLWPLHCGWEETGINQLQGVRASGSTVTVFHP